MAIEVVWGDAAATTRLGAFDAALADAGVHNYNLVELSSVVPPDTRVVEAGTHEGGYGVGAPVSVVLAENDAAAPGRIAAGLGWALADEGGVFIEASGGSRADCREFIEAGLADAREHREWRWRTDCETRIRARDVESTGAVVVAAVYGPLAYETAP